MQDNKPILPRSSLVDMGGQTEQFECDLDMIRRAKEGDKNAFSLLFMKTYRQMYFVAKTFLTRDEDIYDALQNGYAKAYKYIDRLDPPETFLPWLIKIIQNAARDVRSQMQEYVTDEIEEIADADRTPDADRRADMQDVLSRMDSRRAEVLTLYYYDGMKLSEIARLLGEPASTVRSRFKAAKKEILELLKTKDIDSSLYSGSISTMIAVTLRSVIGTDILSAVVAQELLDGVLKDGKLDKAAFRLVEQRRNRSVLHLATVLLGTCAGVAAFVTLLVLWLTGGGNEMPVAGGTPITTNVPAVSTTTTATSFQGQGGTTATSKAITTNSTTTTIPNAEEYRQEVFRLINIQREKQGRDPLIYYSEAQEAVDVRAEECSESLSSLRPNHKIYSSIYTEIDGVTYRHSSEGRYTWKADNYTPADLVAAGAAGDPTDILSSYPTVIYDSIYSNIEYTHIAIGYYGDVNGDTLSDGYARLIVIHLFIV